jgi:hypothetical protein
LRKEIKYYRRSVEISKCKQTMLSYRTVHSSLRLPNWHSRDNQKMLKIIAMGIWWRSKLYLIKPKLRLRRLWDRSWLSSLILYQFKRIQMYSRLGRNWTYKVVGWMSSLKHLKWKWIGDLSYQRSKRNLKNNKKMLNVHTNLRKLNSQTI